MDNLGSDWYRRAHLYTQMSSGMKMKKEALLKKLEAKDDEDSTNTATSPLKVEERKENLLSEKVKYIDVKDEAGNKFVMLEETSEELDLLISKPSQTQSSQKQAFLTLDFPEEPAFGSPEEQEPTIQQIQDAQMAMDSLNQKQVLIQQEHVPIQQEPIQQQQQDVQMSIQDQVKHQGQVQDNQQQVQPQVSQQDQDQIQVQQQAQQQALVQQQLDEIVKTMKEKKE